MRCEDFAIIGGVSVCGHESGDCDGSLYGTPEQIAADVQRQWDTGHGYCDHTAGIYQCDDVDVDDEDDMEEEELSWYREPWT